MTPIDWRQRLRKGLSRTVRPIQFWLRRQLLLGVDQLVMLLPALPDSRRILLVRVDHIGDFVLWLDAARTLTEHYRNQGQQVTLLGNAGWAAWAEELGIFDVVLSLDVDRFKGDLRYRLRMAAQLRRQGFVTAIHAAPTRVHEVGDALVRVTGAAERVGPVLARGGTASDRWYTRLVSTGTLWTGELRKNAALVSGLLGLPYPARVPELRGMVKKDGLNTLPTALPERPYFVLFPGASHPGRKWPASRFVELAKQIHDRTGWTGVVCGGPGDTEDANFIVRETGSLARSLAGKTNLGQLAAVIASAQMLVSNETSAVHIAAVMGVPSVCILGGGHFGRFVPYDVEVEDDRPLPRFAVHAMPCFGCGWTCEFHPRKGEPMPCVEDVSVDAVWREAEVLLPRAERLSPALRVLPLRHNPTKDEARPALVGIPSDFR